MKFAEEPFDNPLVVVVDMPDLDRLSYAQLYEALNHIFPKENLNKKVKSIKFQNINIQTDSINKRERWLIMVS